MDLGRVVIETTLGNLYYMQIGASIIEKYIGFNIVECMQDTVTKIVSIPMFSKSMIRVNTIRNN